MKYGRPTVPLRQMSSALTPSIRASATRASIADQGLWAFGSGVRVGRGWSAVSWPMMVSVLQPYLIPRFETLQGFCRSWVLLPAAWTGLPQMGRLWESLANYQSRGLWHRRGDGTPSTDRTNYPREPLSDGEAELRVRVDGLRTGPVPGLLRFPRGTPPRGRGDLHRLRLPPRH